MTTTLNTDFKVGKLYVMTERAKALKTHDKDALIQVFRTPPTTTDMYSIRKSSETWVDMNEIFLVLELLFIKHTKLSRLEENNLYTRNQWQLKVLIKEKIGFVTVWDYDWEQVL